MRTLHEHITHCHNNCFLGVYKRLKVTGILKTKTFRPYDHRHQWYMMEIYIQLAFVRLSYSRGEQFFHCETVPLGINLIEQNQVVCKFTSYTTDDDHMVENVLVFKILVALSLLKTYLHIVMKLIHTGTTNKEPVPNCPWVLKLSFTVVLT